MLCEVKFELKCSNKVGMIQSNLFVLTRRMHLIIIMLGKYSWYFGKSC